MKILNAALVLLMCVGLAWADDLSDAYDALKAAQAANKVADVKKFASEAAKLARAEATKPRPEDESQVDYWKQRVDYAKQTEVFTEYALAATAVQPSVSPADVVALVETLIAQNSKSTYLTMTVPVYLAAASKAGGKQIDAAAKVVAAQPENEDALYALAEGNMTANRAEQANTYATRLLNVMRTKAAPAGMPAADWNQKKSLLNGRGNYIAGVTSCMRELWADCDKSLRAALPLIGNTTALTGPAYFYLGLANYRISAVTNSRATLQEAIKYSKQSAAIAGPMQGQASQNVYAMEKELPTRR